MGAGGSFDADTYSELTFYHLIFIVTCTANIHYLILFSPCYPLPFVEFRHVNNYSIGQVVVVPRLVSLGWFTIATLPILGNPDVREL